MRTRKYILALLLTILVLAVLLCFAACSNTYGNDDDDEDEDEKENIENNEDDDSHTHVFSKWEILSEATCTSQGVQTRSCQKCGFSEQSKTNALGHIEVTDDAVPATCLSSGKTAGTHCGVCGTIISAQTTIAAKGHSSVIDHAIPATCLSDGKSEGSHCAYCGTIISAQITTPAKGHTEVIDPAVPATCLTDGKSEGSHCSDCGTIIVAQTTVTTTGHTYDNGEIVTAASCIKEGTVKYTCTVPSCNHSYTDTYSLTELTATEIYNQSVKYVGEIITYDKAGNEYALGTGFVIDSNGKIVTNYHVIEGAYSAEITLETATGEKTYDVVSVLAYDANIDLAVLKINARGLTAAPVCKNPVNAGETVYAIGSSRGLTNTYSKGIITYADRVVDGVSHVQHDASITHGNSGGPLINVYGEVIGINTWGISDSQNLNFAVFADELDNLVYGNPVTLAELCAASSSSACDILIEWLYQNYNSVSDDNEVIYFEYTNSSATYSLSCDTVDDYLFIDVYWQLDGDELYVLLELSEFLYLAEYVSDYDENTTYGYIDAATFTANTPLTYVDYDGGSSWDQSDVLGLYQRAIVDMLGWFDWASDYYEMGAGLADLGFEII